MSTSKLTLELTDFSEDENNKKYRVNNVIFSDQIFLSSGKKFIKINSETALKIRDSILEGADVYLTEDQVEEKKDLLMYEDVEIIVPQDLEKAKNAEVKRLRSYLHYSMAMVAAMDFYGFYTSFSELLSRGYNINDLNRDEMYIQIIDTGDSELITALQNYIETSEKISSFHRIYTAVHKAIEKIQEATTQEEFEQAKGTYSF